MRKVSDLKAHPRNNYFHSPLDEPERQNLKTSISLYGVMEPIWITVNDVIVSGHQRWELSKELGKDTIPTRTVEGSEEEIEILIVTTNTDRRQAERDLMRKARQAEILCRRAGIGHGGDRSPNGLIDRLTQDDVAKSMGVDVRTLRRLLKLLCLIESFQGLVSSGEIGLYAGNHLASLTEEEQHSAFHMLISFEEPITLQLVKEVCAKIRGIEPLSDDEGGEEEGKKRKGKSGNKLDNLEKQLLKIGEKLTPDEKEELATRLHELADRLLTIT